MSFRPSPDRAADIAVIGAGVSGLSAAWLLSQRHAVTLFEADQRLGGHCNTVDDELAPVDTGFIVYNEVTYPNLTALFRHLAIPTKPSHMSFAASLDDGRLEYCGSSIAGLFGQRRNAVSPRFWSMLADVARFYRKAPADVAKLGLDSLGDYVNAAGYRAPFRDDYLYPMAAAIWSTPTAAIGDYPAAAFIRFCDNHGLLKFTGRPLWRTVERGSRTYVDRLCRGFADRIVLGCPIRAIRRSDDGVEIKDDSGRVRRFDHVVIGVHADQALSMLVDPSPPEKSVLQAFRYSRNEAVLHSDPSLMPRRRAVWSSWNYLSGDRRTNDKLCVTYWMNRLQGIPERWPRFVTLNPIREPRCETVIKREIYSHPTFDALAMAAQERLWSLQGRRNTWFCGAYFGAGFHEDGLQAGLAVAEALGGVRRPWTVPDESGRIQVTGPILPAALEVG